MVRSWFYKEFPSDNPAFRAIEAAKWSAFVVFVFSLAINILFLTSSVYMLQIYDRVLTSGSVETLFFLSLIAVFLLAIYGVLETFRTQILSRVAVWFEQHLGPMAFARALDAPLQPRGYRTECLRDLTFVRSFVASPSMASLFDLPWIPIYIALVFYIHTWLGVFSVVVAVVLFVLTLFNSWVTSDLFKEAGAAALFAQRQADSVVKNAEIVDAVGIAPQVIRRWEDASSRVWPLQVSASDRSAWFSGATKFVRLSAQVGVLGLGAFLVLRHEMSAGAMIAASIIMGRALAPIEQMIGAWKQLVLVYEAYRRILVHFSFPNLRPDGFALPPPDGELSVEDVVYGVRPNVEPIIKGIRFCLQPGESLAVIGPSGSGKTTLCRLLVGVLEPTRGAVRLGGADVYQWMREDFGQYIGYLGQDMGLFSGTVLENICRMRVCDANAAFEAAQLAGCHKMILRLPNDYRTEIGDGGIFLSAGQRQMIGLARALYGKPRFVVLDEPDSHLDGDSEINLAETIRKLKEIKTTLVIVSHRPSIVHKVDKVLILRDGRMEAFGPRGEIFRKVMEMPVVRQI